MLKLCQSKMTLPLHPHRPVPINFKTSRSFHQTVVTGTRRVDTTWITDSEVTDHSVLGDELAEFCAQYRIYFVKEAQESLEVIGMRTEGKVIRLTTSGYTCMHSELPSTRLSSLHCNQEGSTSYWFNWLNHFFFLLRSKRDGMSCLT